MARKSWRSLAGAAVLLVLTTMLNPASPPAISQAAATDAAYPRIGNYNGYTTSAQAPVFTRYSLALAMDSMTWLHPSYLTALRQANPGTTLLAYERTTLIDYTNLNRYGTNAIYPGWYLLKAGSTLSADIDASQTSIPVASTAPFALYDDVLVDGESMHITGINSATNTLTVQRGFYSTATSHNAGAHIATHAYLAQGGPTTPTNSDPINNPSSDRPWAMNVSSVCPRDGNGQRWIDFLANWIYTNVLSSGYWDGMFIDNSNPKLYDPTVDVNDDNVADEGVITTSVPYDNVWQDGLDSFFAQLRSLDPSALILGTGPAFSNVSSVNGQNFNIAAITDTATYQYLTSSYPYHMAASVSPPLSFVNTSTPLGSWNLQTMRLGLGVTLLSDGVYVYDRGPTQNGTPWWFDEYDNGAGTALSADVGASDTQLPVVHSSLFNAGDTVEVEGELMSVTAVAPGLLTVTRGFSGTVAAAHSAGSVVASPQQIAQGVGYLGQPLGASYPVSPSGSNIVSNGDFSAGSIAPWKLTVTAPASGTMAVDPSTGVNGSVSAAITVTANDGQDLDVRAEQTHLSLSGGATYSVSYWAKSSVAHNAHMEVCSASLPSGSQCPGDAFSPVGTSWAQHSAQFTMPSTVSDAQIKIAVDDTAATTWITGVQLTQVTNPVLRRDFQNGTVLVNGSQAAWPVTLPAGYCHLRGDQNPTLNDGSAASSVTVPAQDSMILVACSAAATATSGTPGATATSTPVPPTATATNTSVPPTATSTPRPPTATTTPLPPTATRTPLPPTATRTPVPPAATPTLTTMPTNTPPAPTVTSTHAPATPTATVPRPTATPTMPAATATPALPTMTVTALPATPTVTDIALAPTATDTPAPAMPTDTAVPPTATATDTAVPPMATDVPAAPTPINRASPPSPPVAPPAPTTPPAPVPAPPAPAPAPTATPSAPRGQSQPAPPGPGHINSPVAAPTPAPVTNPPAVATPPAPPSDTSTMQATATPTPHHARPHHAPALPLTISLAPRRVAAGGTLVLQGRTAPRATVRATLRVTARQTVAGKGQHRPRVVRVVTLYQVVLRGRADAHGRLTWRLRVTYRPRRATTGQLTVTASRRRGTATRRVSVTIQPARQRARRG